MQRRLDRATGAACLCRAHHWRLSSTRPLGSAKRVDKTVAGLVRHRLAARWTMLKVRKQRLGRRVVERACAQGLQQIRRRTTCGTRLHRSLPLGQQADHTDTLPIISASRRLNSIVKSSSYSVDVSTAKTRAYRHLRHIRNAWNSGASEREDAVRLRQGAVSILSITSSTSQIALSTKDGSHAHGPPHDRG